METVQQLLTKKARLCPLFRRMIPAHISRKMSIIRTQKRRKLPGSDDTSLEKQMHREVFESEETRDRTCKL